MINHPAGESFPESGPGILVGPEAVFAWLESRVIEPTTSFEVDIYPSKAAEWAKTANALISLAQEKRDKVDADPNLSRGRDYLKYMTAEHGTEPHTEEFAVYTQDGGSVLTVVRRFSDNDANEPFFTIDADMIEEIGSASDRADARHSHTVVQKATTDEEYIDQKHTRTALNQDQAVTTVAQVLSTLREKVDSL